MADKIIHENKSDHAWVPIAGMESYPQRICECGAVWAPGGMHAGANTITLSSPTDVIRFSSSGVPSDTYDITVVTGGRIQGYNGGAGSATSNVYDVVGRQFMWSTPHTGTTIFNSGFSAAPTVEGTASFIAPASNAGPLVNYATSGVINNDAGWLTTSFTHARLPSGNAVSFEAQVSTDSVSTNQLIWCGLFSADPMGSSDPAVSGIGFKYDSAGGVGGWVGWANDGAGGGTATGSLATFSTSSPYKLKIFATSTGAYFSAGAQYSLISTNLPATGTDLGVVVEIRNITVAGVRNLRIGYAGVRPQAPGNSY